MFFRVPPQAPLGTKKQVSFTDPVWWSVTAVCGHEARWSGPADILAWSHPLALLLARLAILGPYLTPVPLTGPAPDFHLWASILSSPVPIPTAVPGPEVDPALPCSLAGVMRQDMVARSCPAGSLGEPSQILALSGQDPAPVPCHCAVPTPTFPSLSSAEGLQGRGRLWQQSRGCLGALAASKHHHLLAPGLLAPLNPEVFLVTQPPSQQAASFSRVLAFWPVCFLFTMALSNTTCLLSPPELCSNACYLPWGFLQTSWDYIRKINLASRCFGLAYCHHHVEVHGKCHWTGKGFSLPLGASGVEGLLLQQCQSSVKVSPPPPPVSDTNVDLNSLLIILIIFKC